MSAYPPLVYATAAAATASSSSTTATAATATATAAASSGGGGGGGSAGASAADGAAGGAAEQPSTARRPVFGPWREGEGDPAMAAEGVATSGRGGERERLASEDAFAGVYATLT